MDISQADGPVFSVPVEILEHVFDLCLHRQSFDDDDLYEYTGSLVRHCGPILLMQVCTLWRAIVLNSLLMEIPNAPAYPLDLRLCTPPFDLVPKDYSRSVFVLFAKQVHRWQSLSIDLDLDFIDELTNLLRSKQSAPMFLEGLRVENPANKDYQVPQTAMEPFVDLIHRLESLQHFVWIDQCGTTPLHNIPWTRLKTVVVKLPASLEEIFLYISQCTAATTITFESITIFDPKKTRWPTEPFPPISLTSLTSLKLSRGCDPTWLLRFFTMPSLQSLDISILRRDQAILEGFVKRSPCLRSLLIDERHNSDHFSYFGEDFLISDEEIMDYLRSPCLRSIPRVGLSMKYAKEDMVSLIRRRLQTGTPLSPLVSWLTPDWMHRYVGWREFNDRPELPIFSYADGSFEFMEYFWIETDLM
ncbi:unnamed protein product [Cyclocybe aegerita]|uniref:F-box domain-containing protein n=1 Tax=Cyclocybe aegerita TaxID=1973307 RepID=A0A8S0WM38_CYCAE|nr:unnamed protein product [Cyclocybe aegerita]